MARRYSRDNRGRFASTGSGATARGGRLKTAAGNKRATVTAKVSGGAPAGTIKGKVKRDPGAMSKVGRQPAKPAAAAPKPATTAKNRASQMRERAAQLDQRGNALMSGGRRDTAAVNLSLNSRARRNETNAGFKGLEMTRNAERLRSKADRIEYRSNESRAKKLRSVHETPIAKAFAKKAGKSVTEVRAAIRSMSPEKQIKMFKQHVKETRSAAKPAAAAARTAAPKPAAATTNKPSARKADLSPSAFKRRAEVADVRARFAESNVQGLNRANPKNRRAFNRADNMRNAANSYSSILKRSQSSEFSPAQIFNSRRKYSTNPKQTSSEKAAITRANNKMKTFEKNVKAQERARRFR